MKMSKLSGLTVLAVMAMTSQAFALDIALTTTGAAAIAAGAPAAGAVSTLAGVGLDVSATALRSKDAVKASVPDAVEVLKGGEATDAFRAGREGAEQLLNVQFKSDEDAAIAILELNQSN